MGPDLMFVLRLSDSTLIWVMLQAKYSLGKNGSIPRLLLRKAIRSVTPAMFFLDKARQLAGIPLALLYSLKKYTGWKPLFARQLS